MDVAELDRSLERAVAGMGAALWRRKVVFVLTGAAVFSAVLLGALSLQPVYEGSTLLIAGQVSLEQLPDGSQRPSQLATSLSRIAESEEVVGAAVSKVGLQNLAPGGDPNAVSLFARLRHLVFPSVPLPQARLTPGEALLPRIKSALSVRGETNSDVIRVSFRNRDPVVAAAFANAVAQAFVDRQIALYSRPGAADFFQRQIERFDAEFKRASGELDRFSVASGTYSAEDQRALLLKRLNDLEAALALNRGAISDKAGQRQALGDQLRRLAPVTRSSYVASLVESLSADRPGSPPHAGDARVVEDRASDPPLLLIKVYQDSMVELFKINADLAGEQNLQTQQLEEVAKVTSQLNTLSRNEQEFARLKRAVDEAANNLTLYSKRMVEEQINAESSAAKFSSVKVLQPATVPLRPVFPNYLLACAAALVLATLAGAGAALLRDRAA